MPKKTLALRVPEDTLERLRRRSHDGQENQSALVERYIEEGLRRDDHPLIWFRDGAAGRRPALLGTRLDVGQVIETVRQNDNSADRAADYLGIPAERVDACLAYYADFQAEIDAFTSRAHAIADREEARWRRRHELLT